MTITALPTPPSRLNPVNFSERADAFLGALPQFVNEANSLEALTQYNALVGSCTNTLSIATGTKTISTQTNKAWVAGMYVYLIYPTDYTQTMTGRVTSYNSSTGALVVNVLSVNGSGTYSTWNITTLPNMLGTLAFQDSTNASVSNISVSSSAVIPTVSVTDNSTNAASTSFVNSNFTEKVKLLTTTGASTSYAISPAIPATSYTDGTIWNVKFHVQSGVAPTLSVSSLPAKAIVYQLEDGTFSAGLPTSALPANHISRVMYSSSIDRFVILDKPISTASEAASGLNNFLIITPSKIRSALNASGTAPIYACRAWVNFNGAGTVAIRASGNVSSITDNGVGDYTINFTTAMPDLNYCITCTCGRGSSDTLGTVFNPETSSMTTSSFRGLTRGTDNNVFDQASIHISVFR